MKGHSFSAWFINLSIGLFINTGAGFNHEKIFEKNKKKCKNKYEEKRFIKELKDTVFSTSEDISVFLENSELLTP